jgi:serine/threonine protein kinase
MNVFQSLSVVALRQLVSTAGNAVGLGTTTDAIIGSLTKRFTDHSQKLTKALETANERAWKALEIALAGESFWNRCKSAVAAAEDHAVSQQIRAFLDSTPLAKWSAQPQYATFFRQAVTELRMARSRGLLVTKVLAPNDLASRTVAFASLSDPQALLEADERAVKGIAQELLETCPNLSKVLRAKSDGKPIPPILLIAVRYYFRREVASDPELSSGLTFAKLEALQEGQEKGFAALTDALTQQGQRLEGMLDELLGKVEVIQKTTSETNVMVRRLVEQVQQLLQWSQLPNREVRPSDGLSIRNEGERQRVMQALAEYRALPEEERQKAPTLLNNIGKLEVVVGEFEAAQHDFQAVAAMTPDPKVQAEAHFNAYQAALERQDWSQALVSLRQAVNLDAARFAPFPLERYEPQKILGAGGFGVAFFCRNTRSGGRVVIKTLRSDGLDRDMNEVFGEAQALEELEHPAIIRIRDCDFAGAGQARPYLVMDYFDGVNLESYVSEHGPLASADMLAVASQVAEALQVAHNGNILHRDVKPANVLVRRDGPSWRVKLIDFGLALRPDKLEGHPSTSGPRAQTTIGKSIAGTLHYAAPEQMGQASGVAVGRYSDVYGFGRTCYYALLKTHSPDDEERECLPGPWRSLLSQCTRRDPIKRLQDFAGVLTGLGQVRDALTAKPTAPPSSTASVAPVAVAKPPATPATSGPANVWVVRAGKHGDQERIAIDNNLVTIAWNELPDLTRFDKEQVKDHWRRGNPNDAENPYKVGANVSQVWAFLSDMKKGDLAVIPLKTRAGALAVGEVIGTYNYRTDLGPDVHHTLPVQWLNAELPRANLRDDLSRELGYPKTLYRINLENAAERFRAILRGEIDQVDMTLSGKDASDNAPKPLHDPATSEIRWTAKKLATLATLAKLGATNPEAAVTPDEMLEASKDTAQRSLSPSFDMTQQGYLAWVEHEGERFKRIYVTEKGQAQAKALATAAGELEDEQDATGPSSQDSADTATADEPNQPWNGEVYCNFGDGPARSWVEAVKYGLICAGGGSFYSRTLQLLNPGDRVWINAPGRGYIGVGRVLGRVEPVTTFKLMIDGREVPVLDVVKERGYHRHFIDDPDKCEYFVPVRWLQTVPLERAVRETGFFGNQNTICKPTAAKWRSTVERLKERFPDFDKP